MGRSEFQGLTTISYGIFMKTPLRELFMQIEWYEVPL